MKKRFGMEATGSSSPIADITDTARLIAYYRAVESERADALFRDPFARLLAGKRGEEIAQRLPGARQSAWITSVRTRVLDEMIVQAVDGGVDSVDSVDTVLNLAAGLDTRPYRLALPASLKWIEVDLPAILSYKQEKLADEQSSCLLEQIPLDLAMSEERKRLFARVGAEARRVMVITEGFLLYMTPDQVVALAHDLYAVTSFVWWLTDLAPPAMVKMLSPALRSHLARGRIRMQFAPEEGAEFFRSSGWSIAEFRESREETYSLGREMPFGWLLGLLIGLAAKRGQQAVSKTGGFLLLARE